MTNPPRTSTRGRRCTPRTDPVQEAHARSRWLWPADSAQAASGRERADEARTLQSQRRRRQYAHFHLPPASSIAAHGQHASGSALVGESGPRALRRKCGGRGTRFTSHPTSRVALEPCVVDEGDAIARPQHPVGGELDALRRTCHASGGARQTRVKEALLLHASALVRPRAPPRPPPGSHPALLSACPPPGCGKL